MQAVILVGGEGKRMGFKTPKPLLKKGGITLLDHIITGLEKQGISDFVLITNGKKEFNNLPYTKLNSLSDFVPSSTCLLLVGDSIIDFNLKKLISFHKRRLEALTVVTAYKEINYGVIRNGIWEEKPSIEIAVGAFLVDPIALSNGAKNLSELIERTAFNTYNCLNEPIHLTTKEDYYRWKRKK